MYLSLLLKLVVIIPTAILLIYLCRELIVYQNLNFYKRQGLKCFYIPVIGIISKFIKQKGSNDQLGLLRKVLRENANEPMILFNSPKMIKPAVVLIDQDLIREFFVKELDCSFKAQINEHAQFGFFFQNGDHVVEARQTYAQFFNYNNLCMMNKEISNLLDRMMKAYKSTIDKDSWTRIDVKNYLDSIFSEIVNIILFGEKTHKFIDGIDLTMAIKEYINSCFVVSTNPLNNMSLCLLNDWSILKQTRDFKKLFKKIENVCWDIYQDRKKLGPKDTPNLLDLLIMLNDERVKSDKPELTKTEISGHFSLLQFAGSDTSHELLSSILYSLSKMTDVRSRFVDIVDSIVSESQVPISELLCKEYEKSPEYELYCDEFMRVINILPITTARELTKDIKLGHYQLSKGSRINTVGGLLTQMTTSYPQGENFDVKQFADIRKAPGKKPLNFTFGVGKRICIGKSLGDMIVKLVLVHFCHNFEINLDSSYVEERKIKLTYGYVDPTILIKPRFHTKETSY